MVAVEVERMLRLAEQCLERAKSFIEKRADPPDLSTSIPASSSCSPVQSEALESSILPSANTGENKVPYNQKQICFHCIAFSLC